ncbi:MAG: hypothetical protein ABW128_16925 [Rhizorhabdus sp.]
MSLIVHVAQDAIRRNAKNSTSDPAIIVRRNSKPTRHSELEIVGPDGTVVGEFVYSPHKPLPCGARLWLKVHDGFDVQPHHHGERPSTPRADAIARLREWLDADGQKWQQFERDVALLLGGYDE